MEKVSILEEGVEAMERLRKQLLSLDLQKKNLQELDRLEQLLEQQIEEKEAEVASEISAVIAARQQEIENSYEEQLLRQKSKRKKTQEDKLKKKNKKVTERVAAETAQLREENASLQKEVKELFHKNKVSSIYNTRFYYAMFSPQGIKDFVIALVFLAVAFFILPKGILYLAAPKNRTVFQVILYVILLLLVGAVYYAVYCRTKKKAPETMEQVKEVRYKILKNAKEIKKIKRGILKDKDESGYELDSYDKEIQKLDKKIKEIEKEKGVAIATLKNTTSNVLAKEVRQKHEAEAEALREDYQLQKEKILEAEEKISTLTGVLTNEYQAYLGVEYMNLEAVAQIIAMMKEEPCTVSQALQRYQERKSLPAELEEKSVS